MMVDLHCHVLPGIDDGAETLDQSLEFCRVALADGVTTLVATPHQKPGIYANPPELIREKVLELREALRQAGIGVTIVEGAEVYHTPDLPERIRQKQVTTIGDAGRYLLLELSYQQAPIRVEETVFQLRLAGITPILAHPERIAYLLADISRLEKLVRLGCLCQVTGDALMGGFGKESRDFAVAMLEKGLAHILSSDAHDSVHRPPVLSRARLAAAGIVGPERAEEMVSRAPLAVCRGEEWEPAEAPPAETPVAPGILGRLRSLLRGRG